MASVSDLDGEPADGERKEEGNQGWGEENTWEETRMSR